MRMFNRGIAVAALSAPLVFGMTGMAAADEFQQSTSMAGPHGASTSEVSASADANGDGQVSYEENHSTAGPEGASTSSTEAHAGGNGGSEDEGLLGLGILG